MRLISGSFSDPAARKEVGSMEFRSGSPSVMPEERRK